MSAIFELNAELRDDKGKGASRRLRRNNDQIPAIIYGGDADAQPLTLDHKKVLRALEDEAFFSHILTINVAGKPQKAVVKAIQRHPFKPKVLHMDFLRVNAKEAITMNVPLHYLNEDVAPGVKQGGLLARQMNEVEIKCLPGDLPEFLEVDLSQLEMDQSLHLSDIKLPKGIEIVALTHGPDHDLPIASIHMKKAVVEESVEEAGAEADAEAKPAEGDAEKSGE